jgi:hypothetical protein
MYTPLLFLHSWVRWAVLLTGVMAVAWAMSGARTRRPYTPADAAAGRRFAMTLNIQFILGLLLYVWASPFTTEAFSNMAEAMRNPQLRFFVVEHVFGMVVALALAHIGSARIKRMTDSAGRHRAALIFFGLALVIVVLSIPWPGMPASRPIFRGFEF